MITAQRKRLPIVPANVKLRLCLTVVLITLPALFTCRPLRRLDLNHALQAWGSVQLSEHLLHSIILLNRHGILLCSSA